MSAADDASYRTYVTARRRGLVRTAYLLTGSWADAEDAVQECLAKTYLAWRRIQRKDTVDGYVRRTLTNVVIDRSRRPWRRETAVDVLPDAGAVRPDESLDNRDLLMTALASVAPRQRAVLVLRYWEDLSVDQVAVILDCSPGTVKSQASRGLDALRSILGPAFVASEEGSA